MESVHRKISQTMRNFADYAKFRMVWFCRVCEISHSMQNCPSLSPTTAPPLDFACYAKFSHRHAKLLHVGFIPLVFFLASLIDLVTYCQV